VAGIEHRRVQSSGGARRRSGRPDAVRSDRRRRGPRRVDQPRGPTRSICSCQTEPGRSWRRPRAWRGNRRRVRHMGPDWDVPPRTSAGSSTHAILEMSLRYLTKCGRSSPRYQFRCLLSTRTPCLIACYGHDLHAKRVDSLAAATLDVTTGASLAVAVIGQALARARGLVNARTPFSRPLSRGSAVSFHDAHSSHKIPRSGGVSVQIGAGAGRTENEGSREGPTDCLITDC
jgi:hypothetical protein